MVVIVSKEGQLANRLAHASAFIANALAHQYKVVHLFFEDYYLYFSESLEQQNHFLKIPFKKSDWLTRFLQKLISLFTRGMSKLGITNFSFFQIINYRKYEQGVAVYNLGDEIFTKKARSKLVLTNGWMFRDRVNQLRYRDQVVKIFTPNKKYISSVENFYNKYREKNDVLIGVHIRRGDYRRFNEGIWFYDISDYYDKIKEVAALERFTGKKIGFIICSDEKQIEFDSTHSFNIYFEKRHFIEDLYLLAKCDFIIGPPSTFSIWASYYGSVPLYMISDKNTVIENNNFNPAVTGF